MKVRKGFVSNSSSSSFVVIGSGPIIDSPIRVVDGTAFVGPNEKGEYEFGWGPEDIFDIHSRINFAYIQAMDVNDRYGWVEMIENVIKEVTTAEEVKWLTFDNEKYYPYGYIDHQSSSAEGANTKIFESYGTLKQFLFGQGSYIHLDNDNY